MNFNDTLRSIASKTKTDISPDDIDAKKYLWEAFGHQETDISAGWVVRLCQKQGSWAPFSDADIQAFYHVKYPGESFGFNRLIEPGVAFSIRSGSYLTGGGWIKIEDDKYVVTDDFVRRCYASTLAFGDVK